MLKISGLHALAQGRHAWWGLEISAVLIRPLCALHAEAYRRGVELKKPAWPGPRTLLVS